MPRIIVASLAVTLLFVQSAWSSSKVCILFDLIDASISADEQFRAELRQWFDQKDDLWVKERRLGTTVYYLPQSDPLLGYPEIAADAKGVVISLGGAGPKNSSGRTFMKDGYSLGRYRLSVLSVDYPYHGEGPGDRRYQNPQEFMKFIRGIVDHYRASGKPIYFVGRSFGAAVVQELIHENPNLAQGSLLVAPGYDQSHETRRWFKKNGGTPAKPARREDSGEEPDPELLAWQLRITNSFSSNKLGAKFLTTRPVTVLVGDQDHEVPRNLLSRLANQYPDGKMELVPGADHFNILSIPGKEQRLGVEEVVRLVNRRTREPLSRAEVKGGADLDLRRLYAHSDLFRRWFDGRKESWTKIRDKPWMALGIRKEWEAWLTAEIKREAERSANLPNAAKEPGLLVIKGIINKKNLAPSDNDFLVEFLISPSRASWLEAQKGRFLAIESLEPHLDVLSWQSSGTERVVQSGGAVFSDSSGSVAIGQNLTFTARGPGRSGASQNGGRFFALLMPKGFNEQHGFTVQGKADKLDVDEGRTALVREKAMGIAEYDSSGKIVRIRSFIRPAGSGILPQPEN